MRNLYQAAADAAIRYAEHLDRRSVFPLKADIERLQELDVPLQDEPVDPAVVFADLERLGSPTTVATTGGRYYGFVTGGSLPAATAAAMLAAAWDQNGSYRALSPINAALEEIASRWLLDVLGLPGDAGVGFVTGGTMANFTCLAAARHAVLQTAGWDVEAQGLFGAPPITVIVGDEVHASALKAIRLLGLGSERVVRVPADNQGRMRAELLPDISGPTIVLIQAGNVNSGAFDPAAEVIEKAHQAGAWVHVDGAFGLWALASKHHTHLTVGFNQADSWAMDAHKWLNVPQDSGLAIIRSAVDQRAAMSATAAYLIAGSDREPCHYTPEMSRRARGVEIWAALRSLGRSGLSDLVNRTCTYARLFAAGLTGAGYEVLNDVVINQVLVSFGSPERTKAVVSAVQEEGTTWCGGTVWQGHTAMRISVSSWATTEADVTRSLEAILKAAAH